ncbi:MAG: hypothetical protein ACK4ZM_03430 [bacterium]
MVADLPEKEINNELIDFMNSINLPIVLKTKDYHTFVINQKFIEKLRSISQKIQADKKFVIKEKYFDWIDKVVIDFLLYNSQENYQILKKAYLENGINQTIDAFTTENFYYYYRSLIMDELKIKFLYSSDFFLKKKSINLILSEDFLGVKFFIDGTFSSNTAWVLGKETALNRIKKALGKI